MTTEIGSLNTRSLARCDHAAYHMIMNAANKNTRNYATDYVVHAVDGCSNPRKRDRVTTIDQVRCPVTCKKCLAALSKRGGR
jgi:hypothetical protein